MPNLAALGYMVSDKKVLKSYHYINLCKTWDPKSKANFDSKGYNNKVFFKTDPLHEATCQI